MIASAPGDVWEGRTFATASSSAVTGTVGLKRTSLMITVGPSAREPDIGLEPLYPLLELLHAVRDSAVLVH